MASRGAQDRRRRTVIRAHPLTCVKPLRWLCLESWSQFFRYEWSVRESPQQRQADLRALQGDQAERRHSHHLQAQPQA